MLDEIRHFKTPYGTMGNLFDASPTVLVSKFCLEDKPFKSWNHGRTVIIGDGEHAHDTCMSLLGKSMQGHAHLCPSLCFFFLLVAHKTLPSTGAGAVNTLQDAVILDNSMYDIVPNNFDTVKGALEYFKCQRFDLIKSQDAQTYIAAKIQ